MGRLALLTLPGTLVHEASHALAAMPWARRVAVVIDGEGYGARASIEWEESVPWWAPLVASLAPLVLAFVSAGLGLWLWLATGAALPSTAADLAFWATIGAWWSVFAFPSGGDLAVAREAIRGGDGDA